MRSSVSGPTNLAQTNPLPSWNDGAAKQGWSEISMKDDWKKIFAFE
jgi:hypothetical protein